MGFEWQDHHFISGRLCLDFVNTIVYERDRERRQDRLGTIDETLAWIAAAPGAPEPPVLGAYGARRFFLEALRARAACDGLFRAAAVGEAIDPDTWRDLAGLHAAALRPGDARIALGEQGLVLSPVAAFPLPFLAAVTLDALALALSPRIARVKECPGCNWLFVDGTRNGRKRWCEMRTCGNRAKARRHGERVRSAAPL
jgi:predicted RNA-binding Zn ribbon-like protein